MSTPELSSSPKFPRAKLCFLLLATVIVAFVLRLQVAYAAGCINADGMEFVKAAAILRRTGDLREAVASTRQHPLYWWLIERAHGPSEAMADWEKTARLVNILCSSLAAVPLFFAAYWLLGSQASALCTILFYAISTYAVRTGGEAYSEGVYLLFFCGALAMLAAALRRLSLACAVVAGWLAGLAYMARPEGLGLPAAAVGVLVLGGLPFCRGVFANRGKQSAVLAFFGVSMAVTALPYLWMLHSVHGTWMLTAKKNVGHMVGGEFRDYSKEASELRHGVSIGESKYAYRKPPTGRGGSAAERLWLTCVEWLKKFGKGQNELLAVLFGCALLWWRRVMRADALAVALLGSLFAVYGGVLFLLQYAEGYLTARHELVLMPVVYIVLGGFVVGLAARGIVQGARAKVAAFCLMLIVGSMLLRDFKPQRPEDAIYKEAAAWMADNSLASMEQIVTDCPEVAFYLGCPYTLIYPGDDAHVAAQLRGAGAGVLVIDSSKDVAGLLALERWRRVEHTEIRPLRQIAGRDGRTIRIFLFDTDAGAENDHS